MFILAIDIKNVSKSFITKDKDFMALKDVNLHVDDGELICLLGPFRQEGRNCCNTWAFRLWKDNPFKNGCRFGNT